MARCLKLVFFPELLLVFAFVFFLSLASWLLTGLAFLLFFLVTAFAAAGFLCAGI